LKIKFHSLNDIQGTPIVAASILYWSVNLAALSLEVGEQALKKFLAQNTLLKGIWHLIVSQNQRLLVELCLMLPLSLLMEKKKVESFIIPYLFRKRLI
jgi:hypothetical protein